MEKHRSGIQQRVLCEQHAVSFFTLCGDTIVKQEEGKRQDHVIKKYSRPDYKGKLLI